MIRVLLADDHSIVRAGLRHIVEDAGDMSVVAEAADGQEAIQRAQETLPDVAVIDISMPGMDGLEVINQLQCYFPKLPIIVLSMHEEEQYVVRAISGSQRVHQQAFRPGKTGDRDPQGTCRGALPQ